MRLHDVLDVVYPRNEIPRLKPKSFEAYRSAWRHFCRHVGPSRCICEISPRIVYDWLHSGDLSAGGANNYLDVVRAVFSLLVKLKHLEENPCLLVRQLPEPPLEPAAISKKNYRRLLAISSARDKAIIAVLWETGVRIAEMCSMTLSGSDIYKHNGKWRGELLVYGKGDKYRTVFTKNKTTKILMVYLDVRPATNADALFLNRSGKPTRPAAFRERLKRKVTQLNIPSDEPCHPHSFRHAAAVRMFDEGYSLEYISKYLGHKSIDFTADTYLRFSKANMRKIHFGD